MQILCSKLHCCSAGNVVLCEFVCVACVCLRISWQASVDWQQCSIIVADVTQIHTLTPNVMIAQYFRRSMEMHQNLVKLSLRYMYIIFCILSLKNLVKSPCTTDEWNNNTNNNKQIYKAPCMPTYIRRGRPRRTWLRTVTQASAKPRRLRKLAQM